jgi:MFS family permease
MAIMGFGGGAMIASPLSSWLLARYDDSFDSATAIASGSAVSKLFITLGLVYLVVMLFGAWLVRVPPEGWSPPGFDPDTVPHHELVTKANVSANNAIRTPQFWLLWVVLFCNVTAGIGILEQAAPMIQDFFREGGETSVAAASAAGFVGLLSLFNMAGRFAWSTTSDHVGRKNIYMLYLGVGVVLYATLALAGSTSTFLFVVLAGVILSFYGGGFATVPAYLRDLFGPYQVGAIHGRLLTAWAAAGVAGPLIVNRILDSQGEPGNLTAADYRPALLTMVGILVVGFVANLMVRPVAERFHEPTRAPAQAETAVERGDTEGHDVPVPTSALLPVAWALVAIPLAYGVYQTVVKAAALFG